MRSLYDLATRPYKPVGCPDPAWINGPEYEDDCCDTFYDDDYDDNKILDVLDRLERRFDR